MEQKSITKPKVERFSIFLIEVKQHKELNGQRDFRFYNQFKKKDKNKYERVRFDFSKEKTEKVEFLPFQTRRKKDLQ